MTRGKATATLRKSAHRVSEDTCFSIAAEGKTLDFSVPPTLDNDGKSSQVRQPHSHCVVLSNGIIPCTHKTDHDLDHIAFIDHLDHLDNPGHIVPYSII